MREDRMYGWTGTILMVDLTTGEITHVPTEDYTDDFVGGVGIASRMAWEMLEPGIGPFDPDNPLFLMVGPLTGSVASGAGRVEVLGIAPQQRPPVFSRSSMGGHWGAELKYAGYDGLVVRGRADRPVYLWIHDGEVEIRDAGALWGKGTYGTTVDLRVEHGPKTRVVSCGPAGERRSRIAVIQTETGNAAGQGGFGGVMGSKNLKAVAVRGTGGVPVAEPEAMLDIVLNNGHEGQSPGQFSFKRVAEWIASQGDFRFRLRKCGYCATPCVNMIAENVQSERSRRVSTVAWQCWGFEKATPQVNTLGRAMVSDFGLNGWEIAFGIIPWLQMCKQEGLIDEIDGIEIQAPEEPLYYLRDTAPYSEDLVKTLVRKIAFREGELGDALAEGTCYAAYRLFDGAGAHLLDRIYPREGGQTAHWTGHWGTGGRVHWPHWLPPVLQWCIDTRDPASDSTHQWTEHVLRYLEANNSPRPGPFSLEKARPIFEKVYGRADVAEPDLTYDPPEAKTVPAIWHSHRGMVVDSLVLCDREHSRVFTMETEAGASDTGMMAKLLSTCTGREFSEEDLDRVGERVWNQLRAIDVRYFGRDRRVDTSTLDGFRYPGKDDGVVLDRERFLPMLDAYYRLSGWNPENGWPTRKKLESLGLEDVADELEEVGRLG